MTVEGNRITEATSLAISPTGTPTLPPKAVPWALAIGSIAYAVSAGGLLPAHTIGAKVAAIISGVAMLLGLVSPGLRR